MKGKGKSLASSSSTSSSDKECPPLLPDLSPINHSLECPRYTTVINRSESECITIDELDTIQSELEILLANAGKRLKLLETELNLGTANQNDKKDKRPGKVLYETSIQSTPPATPTPSSTSNKRGKVMEERPSKKFKETSGKGSAPSTPGKVSKGKNTKTQEPAPESSGFPLDSSFEIMLKNQPKNDTVNKFWSFVEPYCAEVTNEDLEFLNEVVTLQEEDAEYFKIPSLGKHYSHKWANEDLSHEQKEGAKINDKKRSLNNNNNTTINGNEANNLLKRAEAINENTSPFGPLTQRLVSALIEENIMTTFDESMSDINPDSSEEVASISPRLLAKQLNIGNPAQLERRIRRELEEQGILEADEVEEEDSADDEVLQELRRKQQELRAVTQQNQAITKRLIKLAKEEMGRQDLRKKLIAADAEVMDMYRKIQQAKQRKKPPTKKEKDAVWRALKDRDAIVKQIENT